MIESNRDTKPPRPMPVKVAIGCIIASYVISTVRMLTSVDLKDWGNVIQIVIASVVGCAIVFGIYFGKNWVRWLFVATIAVWLANLVGFRLSGRPIYGVPLRWLALNLAVSLASVILLFYPESNRWFKKRPTPAASESETRG